MSKKIFMTLALLIAAVGGAWAQTQWTSGDCTVTLNNGTLTVSGNGAMADYINSSDRPWDGNRNEITSVVVESGVTSVRRNAFESFTNLTSVTLPEDLTAIGLYAFSNCSSLQSITIPSTVTSIGDGAFEGCSAMTSVTLPEGLTAIGASAFGSCSSLTSITIPSTVTSIGALAFKSCSSLTSITIPSMVTSIGDLAFMSCSAISDVNLYANPDNLTWGNTNMNFKQSKATKCHVLAEHLSTYQNNFSSVNVTFVGDLQPLPTPVEVTTNAASEGATFTEATFTMANYNATVKYDIVRDMSVQMTTTVGGVTDNSDYRIRLQKDGSKWALAELTVDQVMALFKVHDAIENKDLAFSGDGAVCAISIYAVDDQDQPTGNAIAFADLEPGRYVAIATAADGTAYDGQTPQSNVLVLFQGYEVTVPSKEFVTYYKDEPLYADPQTSADAQLYTISSVSGDKAVLSDAITTAPSNTPLLIYNAGNTDQTFLLIPADAEPAAVSFYSGFTGTLSDATIPASTTTQNNYAFNGKKFIWVKSALAIGANKAWLAIPVTNNARTINLVFDDGSATGIDGVARTDDQDGDYYDLNGRKLDKKPTRKGVYIQNGRKVVIK